MDWREYGERLAAEGLVADPDLPARPPPAAAWHMQAVAAFGAWLAALLVLATLGGLLHDLFDDRPGRIVVGTGLCTAAAWLMRSRPRARASAFLSQFALAASLAGIGLLGTVLFEGMGGRFAPRVMVLGGLLAVLTWANPEPVHRALCALASCVLVAVALLDWRLASLATPLFAALAVAVWMGQSRAWAAGLGELSVPVGFAAALTLMLLQVPDTLSRGAAGESPLAWLAPLAGDLRIGVLALSLATVVVLLARRMRLTVLPLHGLVTLAALAALAWACRGMPGILACLLVWLLGGAAGRPTLSAAALAGIGGYLFMLYWSMTQTLLDKGLLLLATALVLALLGWAVQRHWPGPAAGAGQ